MNRRILLASLAVPVLLGLGAFLNATEGKAGWYALGTATCIGWGLFWAFRRRVLGPRRLAKAEAAWADDAEAARILELTAPVRAVAGEVGHRLHLLRGRAYLAQGFRNQAWAEFLEADLARMPFPLRALARHRFRHVPKEPTLFQIRCVGWQARLSPRSPCLRHLLGILLLRRADEPSHREAWEHFETALPLAHADPLLLEDLFIAASGRSLDGLADRALALLLNRHGDLRLTWDRGAAARHLLQRGRFREALALATLTPAAFRCDEWVWVAEAAALRVQGDLEGSRQACAAGLAAHPDAYRLWMENLQTSLELRGMDEAARSLAEAKKALPADVPELRWEWLRREAEFAFWVEEDPERALRSLAQVPAEHQGGQVPPLRLQLLSATGQYEQALAALKPLIAEAPHELGLRLLEAECLAGLEAWEALKPHLDALPPTAHQRPEFWHLRGLSNAQLGDPLPARMDLERAARMAPERLRFVLDAGHACAELGEWERSEEHWRQALRLDPACEEALVQLADSRLALHDSEGARRMLRECLLAHPESRDAQERLADLEAN